MRSQGTFEIPGPGGFFLTHEVLRTRRQSIDGRGRIRCPSARNLFKRTAGSALKALPGWSRQAVRANDAAKLLEVILDTICG